MIKSHNGTENNQIRHQIQSISTVSLALGSCEEMILLPVPKVVSVREFLVAIGRFASLAKNGGIYRCICCKSERRNSQGPTFRSGTPLHQPGLYWGGRLRNGRVSIV